MRLPTLHALEGSQRNHIKTRKTPGSVSQPRTCRHTGLGCLTDAQGRVTPVGGQVTPTPAQALYPQDTVSSTPKSRDQKCLQTLPHVPGVPNRSG